MRSPKHSGTDHCNTGRACIDTDIVTRSSITT